MITLTEHRDARVMMRASTQHEVFTIEQAVLDGVPRATSLRRIRRGRWNRIVGDVTSTMSIESLTHAGRCMAGLLHAGDGAEIGYESAAQLVGAWPDWRRVDPRIHVITPDKARSNSDWIVFHRRTDNGPAPSTTVHDGITATSFAPMILNLGSVLSAYQIAFVINEGAVRQLLDIDELQALLDDCTGFRGVARARLGLELFTSGSSGTRSPVEDIAITEVIRRRLPLPLVCTPGATGLPGTELDLVWDQFRVVLEIDGKDFHSRPRDVQRDKAIDAALRADGWIALRVPAWMVTYRLHEVMNVLADALVTRGWSGPC